MSSNEPKKRLKAAESRRALLDAGLGLLKSRGVAPGLDRVTLKEAIEISGVPRSTAYRLYEGGKGQLEEFRADLLADLDNSVDMEHTTRAIEQAFVDVEPLIASQDPQQLAVALREVIRASVNANLESVTKSLEWRVSVSSLASLGTGADADPEMTEVFRAATFEFGRRFVDMMQHISTMFGLRPRGEHTLEEYGILASAMIEGIALRQHVEPFLAGFKRPTGPNGEPRMWSGASLALEGLTLTWIEADPEADVSADLSHWIA